MVGDGFAVQSGRNIDYLTAGLGAALPVGQALTAAALIFGVFLANPAPVCVLDEVDAPLDDEALRAQIVHHMAEDGLLIEVLGSAASRPGAFGEERVRVMQGLPHIRYRQVLLGFVHDDGVSRWLTHEEICAGVLRAAAGDDVVTVAGQVEPWKLRP